MNQLVLIYTLLIQDLYKALNSNDTEGGVVLPPFIENIPQRADSDGRTFEIPGHTTGESTSPDLYLTDPGSVLLDLWPSSYAKERPLKLEYIVQWEAPTFLHTNFTPGTRLGSLLTLTGEGITVQAQSCEEYLSEKWPDVGPLLLSGLEEIVQSGQLGTTRAAVRRKSRLLRMTIDEASITSDTPPLRMFIEGSESVHTQTLTAMAWLCSAIRISDHDGILYSSTTIAPRR